MIANLMPLADGAMPSWSLESWLAFGGAAVFAIVWAIRSGFWFSSINTGVKSLSKTFEQHMQDDKEHFKTIYGKLNEQGEDIDRVQIKQENHEGRIKAVELRRHQT